jgi:phosphoserine phosphatase
MTQTLQRTALVYDFDGTLARGNVQEHSFIPRMKLSKEAFWAAVAERTRAHDADPILTYMGYMLEMARKNGERVTRERLAEHGRETPLFQGLDDWFDRMNAYGAERGLALEHYIVSSGNQEIIEGSPIAHRFEAIYASRFIFDEGGEAVWPGVAIDYTTKTQFLFRINKGIRNTWDAQAINRWVPMEERPLPFERMIFVGDGDTDIPAMKMVRQQGGHSIAVFDPERWVESESQDRIHRLIAEDRVHFVAPADYREGSQLSVLVKGILGRVARDAGYRRGDGGR